MGLGAFHGKFTLSLCDRDQLGDGKMKEWELAETTGE